MERIYHYTSIEVLEEIRQSGYLEPHSDLINFIGPFGIKTPSVQWAENNLKGIDKKYVVGALDSPEFQEWKEYGLFDDLMERLSETTNEGILLSFPIDFIKRAFIRDHAHISPIRFLELYGHNLWFFARFYVTLTGEQREQFEQQLKLYFQSQVEVSQYDSSYEVPEIWVPQQIPYDKLTLEDRIQL